MSSLVHCVYPDGKVRWVRTTRFIQTNRVESLPSNKKVKESPTLSQHFNPHPLLQILGFQTTMAASGLLVNACDTSRQRYGIRFVPITPDHEVERFKGKSLAVRVCSECGICVMRETHMDATTSPVEETTTLPVDHPMSREFKKMLIPLSGNPLGPWGVSPEEFKPGMVLGMIRLDSMACYIELRLRCPGCGHKNV